MTFQASESRNGGTNVKGGLTTLLMRGSIAMKNFSMLVFRITSVITLQEEQAHHVIELESGAHESEQFRPGIPIETMKTGGG